MKYTIAVIKGDGIGPEVCTAAITVLQAVPGLASKLDFCEYPAGAEHYRLTGDACPKATFDACKAAHAILHGAAGLPGVTYPDGTEAGLDFGLKLRFELDLYANLRPIKLHPGIVSPLRHFSPGQIDYLVLRENTEGMYASRSGGTILRDEIATDTMLITRKGIERITRRAFELARMRNGALRDGKRRVTLCDKANVLRSYAFFRKVFNEVAASYPDIETDYAYVDAMTVYLVERPDFYDVIVAENLFGDIISDLAAGTVGGMGMSPSGETGDDHGFFQASHGSAPTIAGKNIANPHGTILSAAMMLRWIGERHVDQSLTDAAQIVEAAVSQALGSGTGLTQDLGGSASTSDAVRLVCQLVKS
ncbi:MAG: isocitrate/isopropylmalate dehydrogenase family protein [Limnohabitans sp.]|nr:isocitrate/isopropylmalate dehydrogenase family protein [Limnohabitans sp.]